MTIRIWDYFNINSYLVNQLFGKPQEYTAPAGNLINTLETLGEDYAEISAFGQKLNDIYTTLTQNNAADEVLEGARQVFLNLIQNPSGLYGLNTINTISDLMEQPDLLSNFFSVSNTVANRNLNLNGWLEAFENASTYGYGNEFLNEANAILNGSDENLVNETFNNFLEAVVKATTYSPAEELTKEYLSTLFSGLNNATSLQAKNEFLQNYITGLI